MKLFDMLKIEGETHNRTRKCFWIKTQYKFSPMRHSNGNHQNLKINSTR